MADGTAIAPAAAQGAPAAEVVPVNAAAREERAAAARDRKTVDANDPEKRAELAAKGRARRLAQKFKDAKTPEEIFAIADEARGGKPADADDSIVAQRKLKVWEDPAKVAEVQPGVEFWCAKVISAYPDEFRPKPEMVSVDVVDPKTKEVTITKVEMRPETALAKVLAPVVVKHQLTLAPTIEAQAAFTVLMMLGPPSAAWAVSVVKPWLAKRKAQKKLAAEQAAAASEVAPA